MTADLFEQHRQIIALTEELLALVRRTPCPSIEEIAQLRARLGKLGIAHLQAEDELIMRPLLASGRADELPEATTIFEEVRASHRISADHANRWTMEAVDADRDGYADALDRLIPFMRTITARKQAVLYRPAMKLLGMQLADRTH